MKKSQKYVIIFFVIVIIISLFYSVYSIFNENKDNNDNIKKDKVLSELQYLENKFLNLFNSLNNIQYENYRISYDKSSVDENINKYDLKLEGVLNNTQDINWDNIKNEVELIYTSIPTITLDLYQLNLNKTDILEFNKDFDILTTEANNENKENTLNQLSKLYSYLPNFLENTNADEKYKIIIKTKSSIFEAYCLLDSDNWVEMSTKTDNAINTFKELLVKSETNQVEQYNINKCFIMLNELKNAVNEENKEIFLIKYRNLLEEISNI